MKKILFFVMIVVNCHVYTASSSSLDATKESIKIYNKGASVLSLLKDMELLKSFRDEIKVLDNRTVTMNGSIDVTYMRYISDTLFSVDADMNIAYEEKQKDSKKEIYEFLKKKVQGGLEDSFTTPLNDTKEKQCKLAYKLINPKNRSQKNKMRIKEKLNAIDKALTIVENSLELFGKVSPNNKLAKYNLTQITYQETLNTLWDNQKNLRICAENYENIPFSR